MLLALPVLGLPYVKAQIGMDEFFLDPNSGTGKGDPTGFSSLSNIFTNAGLISRQIEAKPHVPVANSLLQSKIKGYLIAY